MPRMWEEHEVHYTAFRRMLLGWRRGSVFESEGGMRQDTGSDILMDKLGVVSNGISYNQSSWSIQNRKVL